MFVVFIATKYEKSWRYSLRYDVEYNFIEDITISVDDDFNILPTWNGNIVDPDKKLREYFLRNWMEQQYLVKNNLGQRISWHGNRKKDYGYSEKVSVKGLVKVTVNGKEYTKEVDELEFENISIRDVVRYANIFGEITIEFSVSGMSMNIKSFIKTLTIAQ